MAGPERDIREPHSTYTSTRAAAPPHPAHWFSDTNLTHARMVDALGRDIARGPRPTVRRVEGVP